MIFESIDHLTSLEEYKTHNICEAFLLYIQAFGGIIPIVSINNINDIDDVESRTTIQLICALCKDLALRSNSPMTL